MRWLWNTAVEIFEMIFVSDTSDSSKHGTMHFKYSGIGNKLEGSNKRGSTSKGAGGNV